MQKQYLDRLSKANQYFAMMFAATCNINTDAGTDLETPDLLDEAALLLQQALASSSYTTADVLAKFDMIADWFAQDDPALAASLAAIRKDIAKLRNVTIISALTEHA